MKIVSAIVIFSTLLGVAAPGLADVPGRRFTADGVVVAVDRDAATITLDHQTLSEGRMPPMRMRMPVLDPKMLEDIEIGDQVVMVVDQTGTPTVFAIYKVD